MALIEGIKVTAFRLVNGAWKSSGTATTDVSGECQISGLVDGIYVLKYEDIGIPTVRNPGTRATKYSGGADTLDGATSFSVTTTADRTIALPLASRIWGTIDSAAGNLQGIKVTAFRLSDGAWKNIGNSTTDATGVYDIGGLVDGTYTLKFEDVGVAGGRAEKTYSTVYYATPDGVFTLDEAGSFALATESEIDFYLYPATTIDITVTD